MSNRRKINPTAVRATWRNDQLDAAAEDAGRMFARAHDHMVRDGEFDRSGNVPAEFFIDRIARARCCPHAGPDKPPTPLVLFLNAGVLACPRCAADVGHALDALADDRCDFCGTVPADNQFHMTYIRQGAVIAFGHFCTQCFTRTTR